MWKAFGDHASNKGHLLKQRASQNHKSVNDALCILKVHHIDSYIHTTRALDEELNCRTAVRICVCPCHVDFSVCMGRTSVIQYWKRVQITSFSSEGKKREKHI